MSQQGSQDPRVDAPIPPTIREFATLISRSGPDYHPIFDRLEPQHVTQFLDNFHEAEKDERQLRKGNRWFVIFERVFFSLTIAGLFVFLTILLLPGQPDFFLEILKIFGAAILGGFGGYGIRAHQDQRRY